MAVQKINETYPNSAIAYKCNVAVPSEIKEVKEKVKRDFGDVDILLHNAGIIIATAVTDFTDVELQNVMAVNIMSHFYVSVTN